MAKEDYVNNFLKKLREQAASTQKPLTREDEDRKIMNTIRSCWKKETSAYQHFTDSDYGPPKTDIEYFAHHFAKAGIGLKDGWEFVKKTLKGYIDAESLDDGDDNWLEYKAEFNKTGFNQTFRDKIVNYKN